MIINLCKPQHISFASTVLGIPPKGTQINRIAIELEGSAYGYSSKSAPNSINWLSSRCVRLPFDDRLRPVPIPRWHTINIGNVIPHGSHHLWSYRSIIYCNLCGAFGVQRTRLLAKECHKHCTTSSERARSRIRSGQLPVAGMSWPPLNTSFFQPPQPPALVASPHQPALSIFDDAEASLPC